MSGGSGRTTPVSRPVTVTLDGEPLEPPEGEPLVCALTAAGKLALARSPKFHRPRGPSCLRAACDGCLARVDDAPNVMTCMVAANLLVFGRSAEPLVKKIGTRWFVSPGHLGTKGGGIAILDDEDAEVVCTVYDAHGKQSARETLTAARATKIRVQGGA